MILCTIRGHRKNVGRGVGTKNRDKVGGKNIVSGRGYSMGQGGGREEELFKNMTKNKILGNYSIF